MEKLDISRQSQSQHMDACRLFSSPPDGLVLPNAPFIPGLMPLIASRSALFEKGSGRFQMWNGKCLSKRLASVSCVRIRRGASQKREGERTSWTRTVPSLSAGRMKRWWCSSRSP